MTLPATRPRPFEVGTTGWTADDLNDPQIEGLWDQGRYEIIEGVLTKMPAARYDGQKALKRLTSTVETFLRAQGRDEEFVFEVDLILGHLRVPKADAILMTAEDERRQREENARRGRQELVYGRILVPPTVLIESVSEGHERHDRVLKRRWYAEAGIPNYWVFDLPGRSLECLVLDGPAYRVNQSGRDSDLVRPSAFAGLQIALAELWKI